MDGLYNSEYNLGTRLKVLTIVFTGRHLSPLLTFEHFTAHRLYDRFQLTIGFIWKQWMKYNDPK